MKPGVPIQINGIPIDLVTAEAGEEHLDAAFAEPPGTAIDAARLVYLKLKARRQKDRVDVVELMKDGLDLDACRDYLTINASQYLPDFEKLVAHAAAEE